MAINEASILILLSRITKPIFKAYLSFTGEIQFVSIHNEIVDDSILGKKNFIFIDFFYSLS